MAMAWLKNEILLDDKKLNKEDQRLLLNSLNEDLKYYHNYNLLILTIMFTLFTAIIAVWISGKLIDRWVVISVIGLLIYLAFFTCNNAYYANKVEEHYSNLYAIHFNYAKKK